jgi:hypothetical protein
MQCTISILGKLLLQFMYYKNTRAYTGNINTIGKREKVDNRQTSTRLENGRKQTVKQINSIVESCI